MEVLRSLLFVPGNRPNMLRKSINFSPDAYVPDLEDSVPDGEKDNARNLVVSYIPKLANVGPLLIPRVNPRDTGLMKLDLAAVICPSTFAISVGKVRNADDVIEISKLVGIQEERAGLKHGHIKLLIWIEIAVAVVNAYEICSASQRTIAVAFGAEDFTNDMGVERTDDDSEVSYPRSVVAVAARAAGIQALDTPYVKFKDGNGLKDDASNARKIGYKGKFAIHPSQIDIINSAFSPSVEEIREARRVIDSFVDAERLGKGSTSLEGKMIDIPIVKRAKATIARANQLTQVDKRKGIVDGQ